jgi:hypothetical protein
MGFGDFLFWFNVGAALCDRPKKGNHTGLPYNEKFRTTNSRTDEPPE